MNPIRFRRRAFALCVFSGVALFGACGGGGGSMPTPAPPASTTVDVAARVIDGPLQNALVCLDKNGNGACDAGEPSARTAADGTVTLAVDPADVGKFALLALVGTSAVDSVSGPVTVPFSLRAPADQTAVVSPLTTVVAAQMDASGLSSAEAANAVQDAAGITVTMFADYTTGSDDAAKSATALARFLVVAKQAAATALQAAVGTTDSSGAAITGADIDRAVERRLIDLMPAIVAGGGADPTAQAASIQTAATALVATDLQLSPGNVGVVIGDTKQVDTSAPPATPTAGASMEWFTFANANDWYFRVFEATAAQSTPDASGKTYFTDERKRDVAGVVQAWGDPGYTNTNAYFDGTQWFVCPADFASAQTPRDAAGNSESFYCGAYDNKTQRSTRDISGQKMVDIVTGIRAYPLLSTSGQFAKWGPDPSSGILGDAVFPAGSKLYYQTSTPIVDPDAYDTVATNTVRSYDAAIAAGGTPVFDANGMTSTACGQVTGANSASLYNEIQTLEQLVAGNPGTACIFVGNASAGPRNDWYGQSTISLGDVAGSPSDNGFYRVTSGALRIAFGAGNAVTYLTCARRASDGSIRNCDPIGTGTYSIDTVADARVLRLASVPAAAAPLTYSRIFVERGGKVYYGFRSKLTVNHSVRPNAEATDALLGQLGLSR